MPMEVLMALQNAESRGESFSKEDFLEGRVGARMIPEDFNFEENVSGWILNFRTNSSSLCIVFSIPTNLGLHIN